MKRDTFSKIMKSTFMGVSFRDKLFLFLRWFWAPFLKDYEHKQWLLFPGVRLRYKGFIFRCPYPSDYKFFTDYFEPGMWEVLDPKGGIFIDCGAHIGRYSIVLSKKASKVLAVEADPSNFSILKENIETNHLSNVVAVNKALWDKDGEKLKLTLSDIDSGQNTLLLTERGSRTVDVETVTLDTLLKHHKIYPKDVSVVKIDVEGAELQVLKGARRFLRATRAKIIFESLDEESYRNVAVFLSKLGYTSIKQVDTLNFLAVKN